MGNSVSGTTSEQSGDTKPKKNGAFQISREPLGDAPLPDPAAHKFETTREEIPAPPTAPAFEDLGELPQSYGVPTLFLVARDPHWLFAYWDIDWSSWLARAADGKFYLKLSQCRRRRGDDHGNPPRGAQLVHPRQAIRRFVLRGDRLQYPGRRMDLDRPLRRRLGPVG